MTTAAAPEWGLMGANGSLPTRARGELCVFYFLFFCMRARSLLKRPRICKKTKTKIKVFPRAKGWETPIYPYQPPSATRRTARLCKPQNHASTSLR
jgi:hypothetical protein